MHACMHAQKMTSMLYRRAGMQDAGSRAAARGARGARAGAPQASPYEKPPSKILERTACSARSAIPHAVLALARAEPCMQRACHYRTTSREPRLPPVTPLCPLTPAAAVTRTRVTMHDACNVYTITARPHVHVSHALTRAAPVLSRPQPLANQSCFRSVRARPCMQRACHSRTPSRERPSLIPAAARRPARTPDHRRRYRHARTRLDRTRLDHRRRCADQARDGERVRPHQLDRPPDASVPIATGAPAGHVMVT